MGVSIKYAEFFCQAKSRCISIEVLNNNLNEYYNDMFCPYCYKAKLYFVKVAKTPHLRTKPSSQHSKDCIRYYEPVLSRNIKKISKILTKKQINNELHSTMNHLLKLGHNKNKDSTTLAEKTFLSTKSKSVNSKKQTRKVLKTKSLNRKFTQLHDGKIYKFYGKVKLSVYENIKREEDKYYYLNILTKQGQIFGIRRNKKDMLDENGKYNLVFIGWAYARENSSSIKVRLLGEMAILYIKMNGEA
ncbi:hypothetical protein CQA38_02590 [Campylobacter sp. MIT 12-5580]|uniref:hypothetical protein n=1 Tax=Campylobacter sp. MIT 12-5580 TaxID=2040651 RepID=UPI0010F84CF9|nr:hypothetical protein [Campylobacter sp. MIT 12-5580]TKX29677.1 hypothetical protein CQA38_02590 [Campylobacter sp. MIT 12-5580]